MAGAKAKAKAKAKGGKAEATRERVLEAALELFRERGFPGTTMRDVARAAGLSLGAAYYHFRSKDDLVLAWYDRQQHDHDAAVRATLTTEPDLRARLGKVIHAKLDLVANERRLLGALFHTVAEPDSPLSVFAASTRLVREQSIALFDEALRGSNLPLPADLVTTLAPAFWMLLLGATLYLIHDDSPGATRTRLLVDGTLDLLVPVIPIATLPNMAPLRAHIANLLTEAKLLKL